MPSDRDHRDDEPQSRDDAAGLRVLEADPRNAEPLSREAFQRLLTPREHHYVRNHYPTPTVDAAEWTISLTGRFEGDGVDLSMDELEDDFATASVAHTMGCSGNGRAAFEPTAGEHQWTDTAVGTAVWTGTPVSEVLEVAAVENGATWLSAMGGDAPEGEAVFCRSIPMEKVREDCILAYEMNGAPLPPEHGFPVRLIVPGWFGNNSVKWVSRLHAMDGMVHGPEWDGSRGRRYTEFQQESYRVVPPQDATPTSVRSVDTFDTDEQLSDLDRSENAYMFDQLVHSLITAPIEGATLDTSEGVEITGVTWAGSESVEEVEVSTNGGGTWHEAELFAPALGRNAWRRFRYSWDPGPGEHTLVSRATNESGQRQSLSLSNPEDELRVISEERFPWNERGYGNNAALTYAVRVTVE